MNRVACRTLCAVVIGAAFNAALSGCGHPTVLVSAASAPPVLGPEPTSVPGIPFYQKHGMCKRETLWAEPACTIKLDILTDGKPSISRTITFSRSLYLQPDTLTLMTDLGRLGTSPKPGTPRATCPPDVSGLWDKVAEEARQAAAQPSCDVAPSSAAGCESLADAERAGNILRVSNRALIVAEVDYTHPYYLNSKTPWIGSSQVNAKLNPDGTLSEGGAQANDQSWAAVLSTVGSLAGSFATFAGAAVTANPSSPFSARATPPGSSESSCTQTPDWPLPDAHVVYRVAADLSVLIHDHVRESEELGAACKPLDAGVTDGNIVVSKADTGAGKEDANTIKVSGEVKLPAGAPDPN
jgi:hypothetical protein